MKQKQFKRGQSRKRKVSTMRLKKNTLLPIVCLYVVLIVLVTCCVIIGTSAKAEIIQVTTLESIEEDMDEPVEPTMGSRETTVALVNAKKEFVEIVRDDSEMIFMEKNNFESIANNAFTFDCVNVRMSPSTDGAVLVTLPEKTYVTRLNISNDGWSEIIIDNHVYYINSYYVGTEEEYQTYLAAEAAKDTTPYNDELVEEWGFSYDLQKYLWKAVCEYTSDRGKRENYYCYLLGVMQHESSLGNDKSNYNSNGTRDLGIMQVNSSNWKELKSVGIISEYSTKKLTCDELQYNDYTGIDAGMYFLNQIVDDFGITEQAYYTYNTGRRSDGTNKSARKVYSYYKNWLNVIYGV